MGLKIWKNYVFKMISILEDILRNWRGLEDSWVFCKCNLISFGNEVVVECLWEVVVCEFGLYSFI